MTNNLMKPISIFTCAFALAGCAAIPPDQHAMPQLDIARTQLASDIKLASEGWPAAQWWAQYHDQQLNQLIEQALHSSPSLEVAAARLGSAHAALAFNSADSGLAAGATADSNRQRYSANGLFPAPIGGSYYNETTVQAGVRYDFDWWGKHKAQIASAMGEVNARRADYAQAEQVLAAAIAQSYLNLQSDWARQNNLQKSIATQTAIVADRVKRVHYGLATSDVQKMAEAELVQLKKQVAQLDAQTLAERESLRALLGTSSNADSDALSQLKPQDLPDLPQALPAKLGMELLARRADLQAARWRITASLSRVEVAQAAFYPDINLTASVGLDTLSVSNLLQAASLTNFIGPAISLPLFDSKRLDARLAASRTERNSMIADYNQTVFKAIREVSQQAVSLRGLEIQLSEQSTALQIQAALLRTAQARFRQGLADHASLLSAELALQKQQDVSLQLRNQQQLTEVALILALGGGYQSPSTDNQRVATSSSKLTPSSAK